MAKFSAFGSSSRNTSKQVSPTMSRATSKKMLEIKGGNDPSKKNISSVKNIVNPDSAKELDLVNNKDNGSKKNLSQRDTGVGLSKSDSVPQALKKDDSLAQGINNKAATPNLSQNQSAGNLNSTEPGSKTESTKSQSKPSSVNKHNIPKEQDEGWIPENEGNVADSSGFGPEKVKPEKVEIKTKKLDTSKFGAFGKKDDKLPPAPPRKKVVGGSPFGKK